MTAKEQILQGITAKAEQKKEEIISEAKLKAEENFNDANLQSLLEETKSDMPKKAYRMFVGHQKNGDVKVSEKSRKVCAEHLCR